MTVENNVQTIFFRLFPYYPLCLDYDCIKYTLMRYINIYICMLIARLSNCLKSNYRITSYYRKLTKRCFQLICYLTIMSSFLHCILTVWLLGFQVGSPGEAAVVHHLRRVTGVEEPGTRSQAWQVGRVTTGYSTIPAKRYRVFIRYCVFP